MKLRTGVICAAALALALLTGCEHSAALRWAPDGSRATFVGADGLHLVDANGAISAQSFYPRYGGHRFWDEEALPAVEWMPDSKHLLVAHCREVTSWNDIAAVIAPERAAFLVAQAQELQRELLAVDLPVGGEPKFTPDPAKIHLTSTDELIAVMLYLWEHRTPELAKILAALEKNGDTVQSARICELDICEVTGLKLSQPRVLVRTLDCIQDLRPSPDGQYLLYTSGTVPKGMQELQGGAYHHLFMLALKDDTQPQLIAQGAAVSPDWSADSRRIAYIHANSPALVGTETLQLGALAQAQVRDQAGAQLPQPQSSDLAGLVFYEQARVRWLRDGRILFSGAEVHLPCTAQEMPSRQSLFMLDPERQAVVTAVVPRAVQEHIGNAVQFFEPSPDQTRVLIPDAGENNTIVSLKTGDDLVALPASPRDLRLTPAWRTNDELSLVVPVTGQPKRTAEVKLWTLAGKSGTTLSAHWLEAAIKELLIPGDSQKTQEKGF